jgi:hypothetical protein
MVHPAGTENHNRVNTPEKRGPGNVEHDQIMTYKNPEHSPYSSQTWPTLNLTGILFATDDYLT